MGGEPIEVGSLPLTPSKSAKERRDTKNVGGGERDGVVTSPPFFETQSGGGISKKGYRNEKMRKGVYDKVATRGYTPEKFGEGNISVMKEGNLDGVISSPPYEGIATGQGGLNTKPGRTPPPGPLGEGEKKRKDQTGRSAGLASQNTDQRYGDSEGQISRLKGGSVDGLVTSPPYEDSVNSGKSGIDFYKVKDGERRDGKPWGMAARDFTYGKKDGQIGALKKETYWEAMVKVYVECFLALKGGGYMAVVVKDFVRKKERVPLGDNTARLLMHIGFVVEYRIRAMLVKDLGTHDLFTGKTKTVQRKSFFRRLQEAKGSPRIDWEEVIVVRKGN